MRGWGNNDVITKKHKLTHITSICMLACLFLTGPFVLASDDQPPQGDRTGENFLPGDALGSIETAKEKALKDNKLVLVVMGANWCHDSRALAARLETPPLSQLIDDRYETVFVDVGNLDKGKDVITSLGEPVWYATPSVLIIDPASGKLINANNRHQWGAAANINMQDSLDYFELMAATDLDAFRMEAEQAEQLTSLLTQIDAFEQQQAERLYEAYAVLTPMLEAYKNGDRDQWSDKTWDEISKFRMQVPVDMDALRQEARQRVAAGEENIKLKFPEYPAFSWEKTRRNE